MGIIIGLDVGTSMTKLAALDDEKKLVYTERVSAADQLTAIFGAVGRLIYEKGIGRDQIRKIMVTGVGGSFLKGDIFGIPFTRVDEIKAIGRGGLYISGLERALVVSLGTGTTFVQAGPGQILHAGGMAMGGGTLMGMASWMLGVRDFEDLRRMADKGDLHRVDRFMNEISLDQVSMLPDYATASNMGRMDPDTRKEDAALGLFNLIYQNVGITTVFACRNMNVDQAVMTG